MLDVLLGGRVQFSPALKILELVQQVHEGLRRIGLVTASPPKIEILPDLASRQHPQHVDLEDGNQLALISVGLQPLQPFHPSDNALRQFLLLFWPLWMHQISRLLRQAQARDVREATV